MTTQYNPELAPPISEPLHRLLLASGYKLNKILTLWMQYTASEVEKSLRFHSLPNEDCLTVTYFVGGLPIFNFDSYVDLDPLSLFSILQQVGAVPVKLTAEMSAIYTEMQRVPAKPTARKYVEVVDIKQPLYSTDTFSTMMEYDKFSADTHGAYWVKDGMESADSAFRTPPLDATHVAVYPK